MSIWSGETIHEAVQRTGGRSRGFDYLRIGLSVAVLLWHSFRTSYVDIAMVGWVRPIVGIILPMFFALSGYLISGSLTRSRSIHEFVTLRAIRIVPALAVETCLSVLVIGAFLTTLPLHEFFGSYRTHRYLLNIVGDIHFRLPGVFETNPKPGIVNASLWTIPFELECYLLVVVLMLTTVIKRPVVLLVTAIVLQIALPLFDMTQIADVTEKLPGRVLVMSFLCGVILYQFQDHVKLTAPLFAASLIVAAALLTSPIGSYFVGLPAAYITVYLGLKNPPKIPIVMDGDYSYGIYLYSYPIQQSISYLLPEHRHWYINAPLALALSGLCAAFSWHVIEKHALRMRKPMIGAMDRAIDKFRHRRPRPDPATESVLDIKAATDAYPPQQGDATNRSGA